MINKRKLMVDNETVKNWRKYVLFTTIFFMILIFFTLCYLIVIHRTDVILFSVIIFMVIYILAELGLLLNYLRWPVTIEVDNDGIRYMSVSGKNRYILWENIISIEDNGGMYIIHVTSLGKEAIPIKKDVGRKIKEEWERWKARNVKK